MISKICLFSILILICYIFSTNKVLEIRLVILIPLTTILKFNWQLCLKLTDPNIAWFNSQSTKKVPTLGLAFSYLRTSILSVFYAPYTTVWLNYGCLMIGLWIMVDFYIASYYFRTSILSVFYGSNTLINIE